MASKREQSSQGGREFKTFGWQGITLTVPADWELAFTRGSFHSGYVRLADEDSLRLEMRWETGPTSAPASDTVNSYLAKLERKARKTRVDLQVQRDLKLASPTDNVECYRWVADKQSIAMMSRCSDCGRSLHLHLLGRPDERLRGIARTVFASLRDHPEGDELLWQFHDLGLRSPRGLPLSRQSLKAGAVRLVFGRRLKRLYFARVSLAEVILARRDLETWLRGFCEREFKRRSIRVTEEKIRGHDGVRIEGRPWLLFNPLRLLGRPRIVRGACWHCEDTNRIFLCVYDGPARDATCLQAALAGLQCCEQAGNAAQ